MVLLNKWDQVGREEREKVTFDVGDRLAFLGESPVLKVSALTGLGVHRILKAIGSRSRLITYGSRPVSSTAR